VNRLQHVVLQQVSYSSKQMAPLQQIWYRVSMHEPKQRWTSWEPVPVG
jgi:hypothetical protein